MILVHWQAYVQQNYVGKTDLLMRRAAGLTHA